jgi:hypothetical protein
MEREQVDAQRCCARYGARDGARDIVILEVQEDALAAVLECADDIRSGTREQR